LTLPNKIAANFYKISRLNLLITVMSIPHYRLSVSAE